MVITLWPEYFEVEIKHQERLISTARFLYTVVDMNRPEVMGCFLLPCFFVAIEAWFQGTRRLRSALVAGSRPVAPKADFIHDWTLEKIADRTLDSNAFIPSEQFSACSLDYTLTELSTPTTDI